MKGSLTVEAALVIPFCFVIVGITCFLGVFLYDQAALKMTGYECILQMIEQEAVGEEQFLQNLQEKAETSAKNRTLVLEDLQTSVEVSASKIMVRYSGRQKMLNLPMDITVVYEKVFPELTLRFARKRAGE